MGAVTRSLFLSLLKYLLSTLLVKGYPPWPCRDNDCFLCSAWKELFHWQLFNDFRLSIIFPFLVTIVLHFKEYEIHHGDGMEKPLPLTRVGMPQQTMACLSMSRILEPMQMLMSQSKTSGVRLFSLFSSLCFCALVRKERWEICRVLKQTFFSSKYSIFEEKCLFLDDQGY